MRRSALLVVCAVLVSSPAAAKVINFERYSGHGDGSIVSPVTVGTAFDSDGVTFTPNTQKVCGGNSNGDPGAWGLEGTNGPQFLCFNTGNPGFSMRLDFAVPQNHVSLDYSAAVPSGGSLTVTVFTVEVPAGAPGPAAPFNGVNVWQKCDISRNMITRIDITSDRAYGIDNLYFSSVFYNGTFDVPVKLDPWSLGVQTGVSAVTAPDADGSLSSAAIALRAAAVTTAEQSVSISQCDHVTASTGYDVSAKLMFPSGQSRTGKIEFAWLYYPTKDCSGPNSASLTFTRLETSLDVWQKFDYTQWLSPAGTQSLLVQVIVTKDAAAVTDPYQVRFDDLVVTPNLDFNADGSVDLLWRNYSTGQDAVWYSTSFGEFSAAGEIPSVSDPQWRIAGAGDFNGDGSADILWRHSTTGAIAIWLMARNAVTSVVSLPGVADPSWQIAAVADMNEDGDPDIVWRNYSTGVNAIWIMDGTSFSNTQLISSVPDNNWRIGGAGDLSGDGRPDLVWRHYGTGANAVWAMKNGVVQSATGLPGVGDLNWQLAGVGRFSLSPNGALIWRNYATGANALWFMDGTSVTSTASLTSITDPNWQIAGPK